MLVYWSTLFEWDMCVANVSVWVSINQILLDKQIVTMDLEVNP